SFVISPWQGAACACDPRGPALAIQTTARNSSRSSATSEYGLQSKCRPGYRRPSSFLGPRDGLGAGRGAGVLAIDKHAIVNNNDDIDAAVAVDVAEGEVARLDRVAHVAEGLPLEDAEVGGGDQVLVPGARGDLQRMLADVDEHDIGHSVV